MSAVLAPLRVPVRVSPDGTDHSLASLLPDDQAHLRASARQHAAAPRLGVAVIGTGLVGGTLLRQLQADLVENAALRLIAVANSRACLIDGAGIAPGEALARLAAEGGANDLDAVITALQRCDAQTKVVIDATPAEAVASRHAQWLASGIHVVSANKIAQGTTLTRWHELRAGERAGTTRYGDAATVGAGLPVLTSLRRLQRSGDRLLALEGVFSGSLSFLFNHYDGSRPFSVLLGEARERGYTEPDPRADLSGGDVARKLLILARAAGFALEERDVSVEGLVPADLCDLPTSEFLARIGEVDALIGAQFAQAAAQGKVLRYLAALDRDGKAHVGLQAISADHPCAKLSGADNLFVLTTTRYCDRPLVISGPGAGAEVTAQALLADALEIAAFSP